MPLYIRDEAVNDLAGDLAKLTKRSKTEAVRRALLAAVEEQSNTKTIEQRVAPIQEKARALGIAQGES